MYVLQHVSLWMVIVGLVIALIGVHGARAIAFPLSYLLTSIPLPVFLYAKFVESTTTVVLGSRSGLLYSLLA